MIKLAATDIEINNRLDQLTNQLGSGINTFTPASSQGRVVDLLWTIVASLFTLAVYGFMLAILFGGFYYLISGGQEEKVGKAKKIFINSIIGLIIVFTSYQIISFLVNQFGAAIASGQVITIIAQIYSFVTVISGAIFLIMLLWAGFRYLLALGNEDGATAAKKQLTTAIIGIILVTLAFSIGILILRLLQIPVRLNP